MPIIPLMSRLYAVGHPCQAMPRLETNLAGFSVDDLVQPRQLDCAVVSGGVRRRTPIDGQVGWASGGLVLACAEGSSTASRIASQILNAIWSKKKEEGKTGKL